MQFLFRGDIRHPAVIAIEATDHAQAVSVLRTAERRGSLEDSHISICDEYTDQRLAAFEWDGDDGVETIDRDGRRLVLIIPNRQ